MGIADPYPLGEMEGIGNSYPGRALDHAIELGLMTEKEGEDFWGENILNWLNIKKEDFV